MSDEEFDPETDCCICEETIDDWEEEILTHAGKKWHKKCGDKGVSE